jgi:hypothetical protein
MPAEVDRRKNTEEAYGGMMNMSGKQPAPSAVMRGRDRRLVSTSVVARDDVL